MRFALITGTRLEINLVLIRTHLKEGSVEDFLGGRLGWGGNVTYAIFFVIFFHKNIKHIYMLRLLTRIASTAIYFSTPSYI